MNTIRTRFMIIVFSVLFCVYLVFAFVCSADLKRQIEDKTESQLTMISKERSSQIDVQLYTVEHIVNHLADYVTSHIDAKQLRNSEAYRQEVLELMKSECSEVVQITDIAGTVYFRPDPTVYGVQTCVFLERNSFGTYSPAPITDIMQYDKNDREHVAWYYEPKERQTPIWVKPYMNRNINIYMTSYVAPILIDGEFFGVVGVDLYMDALHQVIDAIDYESGFGFLVSEEDGAVIYQKDHPGGIPAFQFEGELQKYEDAIADSYEETGGVMHYTWNGDAYYLTATRLHNDMILAVLVPESVILEPYTSLWHKLLLIFVVTLLLALLVIWLFFRRFIKPIRQLGEAATHISRGELNVPIAYQADDEIGDLAQGMRNVSREMQEYVNFLHTQAYMDTMTGVGNKTAYQELSRTLDKKISEGLADFGIAVFDIIGLKDTNEKIGYEYGDRMIVDCCRILKNIVGADHIYRNGGDEFVVVLENITEESFQEHIRQIRDMVHTLNLGAKSYDTDLNLSAGYSLYDKDTGELTKDVFQRAYQAMLFSRHQEGY